MIYIYLYLARLGDSIRDLTMLGLKAPLTSSVRKRGSIAPLEAR